MTIPDSPAASETVIDARDLRMVYPSSKPGTPGTVAVDGVSFQVRRGRSSGSWGRTARGRPQRYRF